MATFMKYRGKPVVIEAVQLTATNTSEIKKLIGPANYVDKEYDPVNLHLDTGHGIAVTTPGTWVIKDSNGKFYPCEDNIFKAKYEKAGV